MQKGSESREADHPIDDLFLDRWSPRAMSGEPISEDELLLLFEAARWAPSSGNFQPWRMLYAHRDTENWALFHDTLADGNKKWTHKAGVLVLFLSLTVRDGNKPVDTHSFDTGSAWENFALQGAIMGLVVHGMAGFDKDKVREALRVPKEYAIEAMMAVGKPGNVADLPEDLQKREFPSTRRPVSESVREGVFDF